MIHSLNKLPGSVLPCRKDSIANSKNPTEYLDEWSEGFNSCLQEIEQVGVEIDVEELAIEIFRKEHGNLSFEPYLKDKKNSMEWFVMQKAIAIANNPNILKLVKI